MQALLAAIITKFTATGSLTAAFPGGLWAGLAPEGTVLPYAVYTTLTSPTQFAYGTGHALDQAHIRFSSVAIGSNTSLTNLETLQSVFDDFILTLSSGQNFDSRRLYAPSGFPEPTLSSDGQQIWRYSTEYQYHVRN